MSSPRVVPFDLTLRRDCPQCGAAESVVLLPAELLAEQPDDTNAVCAPFLGGCNQGFHVDGFPSHHPAAVCEWFAGCQRPATGTTPHPAFPKGVPTCDRCAAFAKGGV